jgi:hypothetical protein
MKRFPLGALLAGAALVAAGYGFHSAFLFWVGAFLAVGFPLGWALWSRSVAKSRIITSIDDELRKDDSGSRRDSQR